MRSGAGAVAALDDQVRASLPASRMDSREQGVPALARGCVVRRLPSSGQDRAERRHGSCSPAQRELDPVLGQVELGRPMLVLSLGEVARRPGEPASADQGLRCQRDAARSDAPLAPAGGLMNTCLTRSCERTRCHAHSVAKLKHFFGHVFSAGLAQARARALARRVSLRNAAAPQGGRVNRYSFHQPRACRGAFLALSGLFGSGLCPAS